MGRLFDFVANSRDGVFAVDRRQSIVLWNEGAAAILGYRPVEVLGGRCYALIRGHDAEGCAVCRRRCDAIRSAERLDPPPTRDLLVHTKQGEPLWLDVSTIVVPSRRNELSALIHVFRERTRNHKLREIARDFSKAISESVTEAGAARPRSEEDRPAELTDREREIIGLLAMGGSTEKIADRLCISPNTVRNHVNNILTKLGVHSRLEAVTFSIRNGLL